MPITIRDETASGQLIHETVLDLDSKRTTVRDLIRIRHFQDLENRMMKHLLQSNQSGDATPDAEHKSPSASGRPTKDEWKAEIRNTINCFLNNDFYVLIDNYQPDTLDQRVPLQPNSQVRFIGNVPKIEKI